MVLIVMQMV